MHTERQAIAAAQHLPYRADIDGMRGIAVLIVVLFHAFPKALSGGFVGVDIFFVISGYLISTILMKEFGTQSFTYATFYARRARRIFPALILVMAATLAFGWIAMFPDELKLLGKHVVGGAAFVSNVFLWLEVGYFDTAAETKPLLHLWSLGIEEQFYIVWPILLALAFRLRARVFWLTVGVLAVSFAVNVGGIAQYPSATFYSIASRAWELAIGALLACLHLRHGPAALVAAVDGSSVARRNALSALGLGLVVAACLLVRGGQGFPGWWALLPTLGAAALIAAGPQAWVNRVILSNRLLVWVGLISYPFYLWHWPLLSFAQIVESGVPALKIRIAAVVAAVALAWLTYRLVEQPIRRQRRHGGAVAVALALLVVALAGFGGWVYKKDGLPQRASIVENANAQKSLILVEDRENAAACKKEYGFETIYEYCLKAKIGQPPTVALIGDSHAYHVVAGLTKYYTARGENLVYFGTAIPLIGAPASTTDYYQQATPKMLELALTTDSIRKVIISTILKHETDSDHGRLLTAQFRATIKAFLDAGKEVMYLYDVPTLDFDPRACIRRAGVASSTTNRDCTMDVEDYNKAVSAHNAVVASVLKEFPGVTTFAPAKYMCDDEHCKGMIDRALMYRDNNHLSYEGDLYVGARFAEEQAAAGR